MTQFPIYISLSQLQWNLGLPELDQCLNSEKFPQASHWGNLGMALPLTMPTAPRWKHNHSALIAFLPRTNVKVGS